MQPSDPPAASPPARYPSRTVTLGEDAFLNRPPVHPRTGSASDPLGSGAPRPRLCRRTVRGLPGYWAVRACVLWSWTPPGEDAPGPMSGRPPRPSGMPTPSARRNGFSGLNSTAHVLACLRINHAVTDVTARLATDLPGSALVGRDSHPRDDFSKFHGVTVTPFLLDQQGLVATGIVALVYI
jgi:hypothetical protein